MTIRRRDFPALQAHLDRIARPGGEAISHQLSVISRWGKHESRLRVVVFLLLLVVVSSGCQMIRVPLAAVQPGNKLTARSLTSPDTTLESEFDTALYSFDGKSHITVLLYDGPIDNPTQAVTIRMFWRPHAGRTPLTGAATNATVHCVIFTGDQNQSVGIYSGAGFLHPKSKPGKAKLSADLRDATLRLTEHNAAFADILGQAVLEGRFSAQLDSAALTDALRRLQMSIRKRLGYPRMVRADRSAGRYSSCASGVSMSACECMCSADPGVETTL